jgi:hypothetical protein
MAQDENRNTKTSVSHRMPQDLLERVEMELQRRAALAQVQLSRGAVINALLEERLKQIEAGQG